jgi:DNA-binding transcriptional LysR family regulator
MLRSYVVASPAFLKKNGTPKEPHDLERFDCAVFGAGADRSSWKLHRDGKVLSVNVRARFTVNDFDFLDEAARSGLGVAMLPVFRCIDAIRTKRLKRVLPEWRSPEIPLHAVYPSTRHLSPKVRAFLDHLRDRMTPAPWELGPVP